VLKLIKECTTPTQWKEIYPVIKQLRTHLSEKEFLEIVEKAIKVHQYKLYGVWEGNEVMGAVGFMPMTTLYYGDFIWICDLVTDNKKRSKGYGTQLIDFVETYAIERSYFTIALSSGINRLDAHRFYEEKGEYHKVSYVFKKDLSSASEN